MCDLRDRYNRWLKTHRRGPRPRRPTDEFVRTGDAVGPWDELKGDKENNYDLTDIFIDDSELQEQHVSLSDYEGEFSNDADSEVDSARQDFVEGSSGGGSVSRNRSRGMLVMQSEAGTPHTASNSKRLKSKRKSLSEVDEIFSDAEASTPTKRRSGGEFL